MWPDLPVQTATIENATIFVREKVRIIECHYEYILVLSPPPASAPTLIMWVSSIPTGDGGLLFSSAHIARIVTVGIAQDECTRERTNGI